MTGSRVLPNDVACNAMVLKQLYRSFVAKELLEPTRDALALKVANAVLTDPETLKLQGAYQAFADLCDRIEASRGR